MKNKLLPCPLCEGTPQESFGSDDGYKISCFKCGLITGEYDMRALSVEAWNTRPPHEVSDKQSEAGEYVKLEDVLNLIDKLEHDKVFDSVILKNVLEETKRYTARSKEQFKVGESND